MTQQTGLKARRVEATNSLEAINDLYYQRSWTDGLPIIPPTEDRVWNMVRTCQKDPGQELGKIAPGNGTATVEKVAINAVMAGCQPDHFPVVVAAIEAICQEPFNVGGIQATTGGAAPLIIINGPIAPRLNVNADTGAFGHGYRSNASIGRAVRLVMRNIGKAIPGEMDKSTLGHAGKYTMCIAENEGRSPWVPLHVERGYSREASTVTAVGVTGAIQLSEMTASSGLEVLNTFCDSLTLPATFTHYIIGRHNPVMLVLGPEHASEMAADGFSKADVKRYIFENARMAVGRMRDRGYWSSRTWPEWVAAEDDSYMVPPVSDPEDIIIVVAGGDGRHSAWLPTWPATKPVTVPVEL